jgi:trigger factor
VEGGSNTDHPLVLGSKTFIPGFEEAIIGMTVGEEKSFDLDFPGEYHAKHLAGKRANFSVKLKSVEERVVPALDDAFAKSLGRFDDLAALKKSIHDGMLEERKQERKDKWRTAILDALFADAELDYPEVLVQEEKKQMLGQFRGQVEGMGLSWDRYLKEMKKSEEEVLREWEPQAKKRIAAELILQKLAADEAIEVSSEDIEAEMNKALQYYKNVKEAEKQIDLERLYAAVRGKLLNDKVLAWLESL